MYEDNNVKFVNLKRALYLMTDQLPRDPFLH